MQNIAKLCHLYCKAVILTRFCSYFEENKVLLDQATVVWVASRVFFIILMGILGYYQQTKKIAGWKCQDTTTKFFLLYQPILDFKFC